LDISIIIVNYNVREFLRGALESVRRSLLAGGLSGEVMIVDNASTDGSQEMVRRDFPEVTLYDLPKNVGFGRANNIAMREAKGDYLLILNPDTILGEDTLRVMVNYMRAHSECGVSGCKLLNADGSFQISCRRGFPTPWASFTKLFGLSAMFPNSPLFSQYNLTYLPDNQTYEIDALAGAFMLLSQDAFKKTGGFDEDFFMYGEDLDLSYRIKKAGLKVMYVHTTSTIHFKGESTRRSVMNEVKVFYEAMHIFVKKHYGASPIFTLMLRFGIMMRSILAFFKKYRGAIILGAADMFMVFVAILGISKVLFGAFQGLPEIDYPWVFIVPPLVIVGILWIVGAYQKENRRKSRSVILAMPAALIVLSSLTYFFKEFTASRSLILMMIGVLTVLLVCVRISFRVVDRFRYGGEGSAKPMLRRTLIAGTGEEALRIAGLLRSSGFLKRYELVGFIGDEINTIGRIPIPNSPILGTLGMLPRVIKQHRISQVIFPSDAFSYSEMLTAMQAVSGDLEAQEVSFNVVPQATDVLLSRSKIEVISPEESTDSFAVMPLEYNVQKMSHRFAKRVLDIVVGILAFPFVAMMGKSSGLGKVVGGKLSLVGMHSSGKHTERLAKLGLLSLADITYDNPTTEIRPEDIDQLNLYYARHHTIGMDIEILLRSVFRRSGR
jgi:GT2 family glycosyltransferase